MNRNIAPTAKRRSWGGLDHRPPASMRDRTGTMWKGTSRVLDPKARRAALKPTNGDWRAFFRETGLRAYREALFGGMTVGQLRAECTKRQVHFKNKDLKADLVRLLLARYPGVTL